MLMYNTYHEYLMDAYPKLISLGEKSKQLIKKNLTDENIEFNHLIPMYELMASSLYQYAISIEDLVERKKHMQISEDWFRLLDDMNHQPSQPLLLKKAMVLRELLKFDEAVLLYQQILLGNAESFLTYIHLTQTYLEMELEKQSAKRNYSNVYSSYSKLATLKNSNQNLTVTELSQYVSLKKQLKNAGLEVK